MPRLKELNIGESALIVIDMQNYFMDPESHAFVPDGKKMIPNIQKLINKYHESNQPVIFTSFAVAEGEPDPIMRWWGDSVREGEMNAEICDELKPAKEDLVIRKSTYSSFYKTELEEYLHQKEVKQLVITGVLTNLCCETTAREAFVRNFDVFVVEDCVASYDEDQHRNSLENLAYGFAVITESGEILKNG